MLWISPALTVYICVLTGILGACMGSFLNCMAWRIVHGESVYTGARTATSAATCSARGI